jgi:hypothetical protein
VSETKAPVLNLDGEGPLGKRRSQRIHLTMPVVVRGKIGATRFEERTNTVTVNAHGCMLHLKAQVTRGQEVSIVNPVTIEEVPCVVIFLGKKDGDKLEVGIEFSEPSALFWRVNFPPEDWNPEERKRPASSIRPPSPVK